MTARRLPPGRGEPRVGLVAPHGIGGYLSPSFYFFTRTGEFASHRFYAKNCPAQGFRCAGSARAVRARMKATAGPMRVEPVPAQLPCAGGNSSGTGGNGWRSITDMFCLRRMVAHSLCGFTRGCARPLSVSRDPWGVEPEGSGSRPSRYRRRPSLPGFVRRDELAESPFFIEPYRSSSIPITGASAITARTRGLRALECGESCT